MDTILAAVLSGMISWVANGFLIKWLGEEKAVVYVVPVLEESSKTLLAFFLGGAIFYTHMFFGALEGVLDIRNGSNGFKAAIYSVITHSAFGLVTTVVYVSGLGVWGAILAGTVAHMGWNWYIMHK